MLPDLAKVQVLQEAHWPPASPARLVAWSGGQGHLPTGQLAPAPGSARVDTQSLGTERKADLAGRWKGEAAALEGRPSRRRGELRPEAVFHLLIFPFR